MNKTNTSRRIDSTLPQPTKAQRRAMVSTGQEILAARPRLCPVCQDGACETKSMRCGK